MKQKRKKILWKEGEDAKQIKKRERAQSLLTNPPTPHELESLHQMHFSTNENNGKIVSVKDTALSSVTVTQPQERNTKDKIFGGYLMRKAYELGMATALKFFGAHSNPFLLAVDEISFHRPVEIGSIITFDASVVFTTEKACQIKVETAIHDLVKDEKHKSNSFHLTFGSDSSISCSKVKPITYCESIDYIEGERRLNSSLQEAIRQNSTLTDKYH